MLALALSLAAFSYCDEAPSQGPSTSVGAPSNGRVEGAWRFEDTDDARVLPLRHQQRCLSFGSKRLVQSIARAAKRVRSEHPGGAQLGVGNIGRARGGPIRDYSHSHQAGRDADLAFYLLDNAGAPVAATDLVRVGDDLVGLENKGVRLDVPRTWTLVRALLEDSAIDVRWLFASRAIAKALLEEAVRTKAPARTIARAREVLHQPSDAPPHDDHLHLRIRCTAVETRGGCRDG